MINVISSDQDKILIMIHKNINFSTVDTMREELNALLSGSFKSVVLDFSNVEFVDSTGVGMLLGYYTSLKSSGRQLIIKNANDNIKHLFNLIRLDSMIQLQ